MGEVMRHLIHSFVVVSLFVAVSPAWAQTATDVELNIAEQPLSASLREVADSFDLTIAFYSESTDGLEAPALDGDFTSQTALDTLLAGTNLEYAFISDSSVAVRSVAVLADQGGDSDSKNSITTPVLMAQDMNGQATVTEVGSRSDERGTSIVTGRITDARTGVNLKGARVTIEETGQWTSTGNLGRFRFSSVPIGSVTLTVSFLGYAGQSAVVGVRGRQVTRDFALRGGSELEEIVVYGSRSARALALNQERTAPNSTTVINADQLGVFNGTTISEALRRAPGIAFVPNVETGDGANIIVRGLEPDLNQVQVNGVRLLEGSGLGRSADLSSILTESIESVTINKSLLPSQDSNGAGGLVEIETKSPLDRDAEFYNLNLRYGSKDGDFGDELQVGGTVSRIFGDESDFGVSLSVDYRERETAQVNYNLERFSQGEFLPLDGEGQPIRSPSLIDPTLLFPFEPGAGGVYPTSSSVSRGSTEDEILNLSATIEKELSGHTNLRFDTFLTRRDANSFAVDTQFDVFSGYVLAPVPDLGGEERYALVTEGFFAGTRNEGRFGPGIAGQLERGITLRPSQSDETISFSFRGETVLDRWTFEYSAGYVEATSESGRLFDLTLSDQRISPTDSRSLLDRDQLLPEAFRSVTEDGRIISIYAPLTPDSDTFVLPLITAEAFAAFDDVQGVAPSFIFERGSRESESRSPTLEFAARREFEDSPFRYVSAGINFQEQTSFSPGSTSQSSESSLFLRGAAGVTAGDVGLAFGPGLLTDVGVANDFSAITRSSAEQVFTNLDALIESGAFTISSDREANIENRTETVEQATAAYLEGQVDIGKVEVIGGFRIERVEIDSEFFASPSVRTDEGFLDVSDAADFVSESVSQTEVLPRLLINYRFSDDVLFRAGYTSTVSRPQLRNLTARSSFSLDTRLIDRGNGRPEASLVIFRGNPDLKPSFSHKVTLDGEWYFDDVGVAKVSVFYNSIENPLQGTRTEGNEDVIPSGLLLPDLPQFQNLPEPLAVSLRSAVNGDESDDIWGVELSLERRLTFLPSPWDGLGVFGNYTYTDSERTVQVASPFETEGFFERTVPFFGSPEHQGTVGLLYTKYGVDASLYYTAQDRRLRSVSRFGFDTYDDAIDTMDLRIDYLHEIGGANVRFFFEVFDLLSDSGEPFLQTSVGGENIARYYTGASYYGGRTLTIGVSTTF